MGMVSLGCLMKQLCKFIILYDCAKPGSFRPDGVAASVNGSATQPDQEYAELIVSWDFDPGCILM